MLSLEMIRLGIERRGARLGDRAERQAGRGEHDEQSRYGRADEAMCAVESMQFARFRRCVLGGVTFYQHKPYL